MFFAQNFDCRFFLNKFRQKSSSRSFLIDSSYLTFQTRLCFEPARKVIRQIVWPTRLGFFRLVFFQPFFLTKIFVRRRLDYIFRQVNCIDLNEPTRRRAQSLPWKLLRKCYVIWGERNLKAKWVFSNQLWTGHTNKKQRDPFEEQEILTKNEFRKNG